MEEASGTQLGEVWDDLDLRDKFSIVDDIVALEKKFLSISFTRSDLRSLILLPTWLTDS